MIEAFSHVLADVFGFVSFHPSNTLYVLSCSLRSEQRTVGTSSFPVQIHIFRCDSVAQHCMFNSIPATAQCPSTLPHRCGNHLMQSLLRTGGEQLVTGLTLTRHLFFLNGSSWIISASCEL